MSLFDNKNQKTIEQISRNAYNTNEFYEIIKNNYYKSSLFQELNLITSNFFGMNFDSFLNNFQKIDKKWNLNIEHIELIFLISNVVNSSPRNYHHLKDLIRNNKYMRAFLQKTYFQIETSPYKLVDVVVKSSFLDEVKTKKLIKEEIGEILEIIDDPEINMQIHKIFSENNFKNIEKEFFIMQKTFYKDLQKIKSSPPRKSAIKFEILNRKIQAFVRHDKEHNDKEMKEFYKTLSDEEKIKELRRLSVEFLCAIYFVKE